MVDKPLDDKNSRKTKFHPDVQDPMNAIESDSLNKQRKLDQYNNAGSVGQSNKVPDVKYENERNSDGAIIAGVISQKTIDDKTLQRQLDPAASNDQGKRDNSVLDEGKRLITNKGAMNSVEESTVGNKEMEDEQLTNKQTTIQKKEVTESEDNKEIAPPAAPVIIKGQRLEERPLDYVNPVIIGKGRSNNPTKNQPVIGIGWGVSKVNEVRNMMKIGVKIAKIVVNVKKNAPTVLRRIGRK